MDADKVPETKASRAFRIFFEQREEARGEARGRARGRVQGKQEGLLVVLAARGFSPSHEERASIAAVADLAMLDRCIQAAVTAASVGAVLAGAVRSHRRREAPARAAKPRTVKHASRRR